jgi:hypothetical protein
MVDNEFDRDRSCGDSFDGFDAVMWCAQVDSGEDRIVVRLYVFFPFGPRGEYLVETRCVTYLTERRSPSILCSCWVTGFAQSSTEQFVTLRNVSVM